MNKMITIFTLTMFSIGGYFGYTIIANSNNSNEEIGTTGNSNNQILIFEDKSMSFTTESTQITRIMEWSNKVFTGNGDNATVFFIHENTLGVNSYRDYIIECNEGGGLTKDRCKARARKFFNEDLPKSFTIENTFKTSKYTDIWALFELVSRNAIMEESTHVLIVSDMVESMPDPKRRDFHKYQIKSKAEAEKMAKEDAQWIINNMDINTLVLGSCSYTIALPGGPAKATNWGQLRYYWKALFKELNIENGFQEL